VGRPFCCALRLTANLQQVLHHLPLQAPLGLGHLSNRSNTVWPGVSGSSSAWAKGGTPKIFRKENPRLSVKLVEMQNIPEPRMP
jgi:hypothetical protein